MSRYTQEQFEEHYKKLPQTLRRALHSPDNATTMIEIGKKHGLTIEEIGYAAEEIGFVIMGLTPARLFTRALKERLNKSEDEIKDLAADINHQVFYPLREDLKKAHDFDLTIEAIQQGGRDVLQQTPSISQPQPLPPRPETPVQQPIRRAEPPKIVPQPIPHTGIRPIDLRKSMVAESQDMRAGPKKETEPARETPIPASHFPGPAPQFRPPASQSPPQKLPPPPPPKSHPFPPARPTPLQTPQTNQKPVPAAERLPAAQRPQISESWPLTPRESAKPVQPQLIKPLQPSALTAPRETPKQIPPVPHPKPPSVLPYLEPLSEKVPPIDLRKTNEKPERADAAQTSAKPLQTKRAPEPPQKKDGTGETQTQTEKTPEETPPQQKKPDVPQKQITEPAESRLARAQLHERASDPYREPLE